MISILRSLPKLDFLGGDKPDLPVRTVGFGRRLQSRFHFVDDRFTVGIVRNRRALGPSLGYGFGSIRSRSKVR